jgi:hypothetical protein
MIVLKLVIKQNKIKEYAKLKIINQMIGLNLKTEKKNNRVIIPNILNSFCQSI